MKLLLHYLRYEWVRWRKLLAVLWLIILVTVWLVLRISRMESGGIAFSYLEIAVQTSLSIAGFCFLAVVILVSAADSPVCGRGWLMTRPTRRGMLMLTRGAFLFFCAALPMVAGYAVVIAILEFNRTTVFDQALYGACTVSAILLTLMA